jgi:hypothetical protein
MVLVTSVSETQTSARILTVWRAHRRRKRQIRYTRCASQGGVSRKSAKNDGSGYTRWLTCNECNPEPRKTGLWVTSVSDPQTSARILTVWRAGGRKPAPASSRRRPIFWPQAGAAAFPKSGCGRVGPSGTTPQHAHPPSSARRSRFAPPLCDVEHTPRRAKARPSLRLRRLRGRFTLGTDPPPTRPTQQPIPAQPTCPTPRPPIRPVTPRNPGHPDARALCSLGAGTPTCT